MCWYCNHDSVSNEQRLRNGVAKGTNLLEQRQVSVAEPEEASQQVRVISHTDEVFFHGTLIPVRHASCAQFWVAYLQLSVVDAVHLGDDRGSGAKWSVELVGHETCDVTKLDTKNTEPDDHDDLVRRELGPRYRVTRHI